MSVVLPLLIGVLFAAGLYLLMSPFLVRIIFGFLVLSQAVNLLLFSVAGLSFGQSPIIPSHAQSIAQPPESLSQALILTAIVIGFASTAFLVVLARQGKIHLKTDQVDEMHEAEK